MLKALSESHPIVRYAVSAIVSVIANLLAQEATVTAAPDAHLMVSIVVGTIIGFLIKYVVDKIWTFRERYTTAYGEAQRITMSGLFSVLTTLIFWAFELGFHAVWQTDFAKYLGAVIGLSIGYVLKFWLDRRHVFRESTV
ncbi:GtrA family protein [Jannaschia marina]|uniref:GtrA family protein n=1 Tax=Jannaschia marina TaxID=2741674 RepID=UPI0015CC0C59|nr:GtrA family protein [Jannaschia marina]